jgi:hypothetical protein
VKKSVVVFYNARWYLPLRATNEAHLRCWGRYSKHHVIYVNVAYGVPWTLLRRLSIGAVIFDTIFLSMHWSPDYFRAHSRLCFPVADFDCPKIAVVQDEFYNIDLVVDFLRQVGATHVLTCSFEPDWPKFYGGLDRTKVVLRTVLTGYVDETRLPEVPLPPPSQRPIHIGYRAWDNPYWLGDHGQQKVRIGRIVGAAARERGLPVDINNPAATDFLLGDEWYAFLGRCRSVLGVEGGASVIDHDGSLTRAVEAYVKAHPGASFEETRVACFPDRDHEVNLSCLSPRHLEACATRTCQVLLEGHYNGVLRPWDHYIPIRKDYGNVQQALDALCDDALVDRIAENAYRDVVESGRWSYRRFVADIEREFIDPAPVLNRSRRFAGFALAALRLRERLLWRLAHVESAHRQRVWKAYGYLRNGWGRFRELLGRRA